MAAYLIAQIEIADPQAYEAYKAQVPATLEAFGGRYLARGGRVEVLEGDRPAMRTIIIQFDSMDAALAWHASESYRPVKALRQAASRGELMLVEGL